jgi:hypothetical protein
MKNRIYKNKEGVMRVLTRFKTGGVLIFLTLLVSAGVFAAPIESKENVDLGSMSKSAEFVFEGTVVDIQYRNSDVVSAEDISVPHTFVTFRVSKAFKGKASGETITLRFLGGMNKDGMMMRTSLSPLFNVGDTDILFVRSNGKSPSPLVNWDKGRFRVINEKIYSSRGSQVLRDESGKMILGAQDENTKTLRAKIGENEVKTVCNIEPPEAETSVPAPKGVRQLGRQEFMTQLENAIKNNHTAAELKLIPAVRSADPTKSFSISAPIETIPSAPKKSSGRKTLSDEDREEARMLKENGGNPVFKNK